MTHTYKHPDGFTFHVKLKSLIPRLLGHTGVTIGDTIHFKSGYHPRVKLLSHETRHLQQYRTYGTFRFLWQYLTSPTFKKKMEDEAIEWSDLHWNDAWLKPIVTDLSNYA